MKVTRYKMAKAAFLVFSPSIYLLGCIFQLKPLIMAGIVLTAGNLLFILFDEWRGK